MSLLDENGRLFGRINLIDFVVILILVLVVGKVGYDRLLGTEPADRASQSLEITVLTERVRQANADAIAVGDRLWILPGREPIGEVTHVEVVPAIIVQQAPDGTLRETESTRQFDIFVTLQGEGRVSPDVIMLGDREVRVGTRLNLKSVRWELEATVMNIETQSAPENNGAVLND